MASIEIRRIGDNADLTALKRNFANLLQEKFGSKPTLAEAVASKGIDEKHELRLLQRRARYVSRCDRPKIWPSYKSVPCSWGYSLSDQKQLDQMLATLRNPPSTADYVSAWTRLNHLVV